MYEIIPTRGLFQHRAENIKTLIYISISQNFSIAYHVKVQLLCSQFNMLLGLIVIVTVPLHSPFHFIKGQIYEHDVLFQHLINLLDSRTNYILLACPVFLGFMNEASCLEVEAKSSAKHPAWVGKL